MGQDGPKMAQDEPKGTPRWPQETPRGPQRAPKRAQWDPRRRPKWTKMGPKSAQRLKMNEKVRNWKSLKNNLFLLLFWGPGAPSWAHVGLKMAQLRYKWPHVEPSWVQDETCWLMLMPRWPPRGPMWPPRGPMWANLRPTWANWSSKRPQHKPVLIRNGTRVWWGRYCKESWCMSKKSFILLQGGACLTKDVCKWKLVHVKEILHLTARGACLAKDVYKCNAIKKSILECMKSWKLGMSFLGRRLPRSLNMQDYAGKYRNLLEHLRKHLVRQWRVRIIKVIQMI